MTSLLTHARRIRLLPDDRFLGWTPFVWLVYLPMVFALPFIAHARPVQWAVTIACVVVFLPLYFRGYWARGREIFAIIAAIALLGAVLVRSNPGGWVFETYAAAFAGLIRPKRVALRTLVVLSVTVLVQALVWKIPWMQWGWELLLVFIVGIVNMHFASVRETNVRLSRAHEEIEHLARVAERERIARDLHDLLGHTLSLITLKSSLASRLADRDPARAIAEIRDVERISREALSEVRAAVAGYRDAGMGREIGNARRMLDAAGVALDAHVEPLTLAPVDEAVLAMAVREAVTNVVRHANAKRCTITVTRDDVQTTLVVQDDGVGMRDAHDGNGLTGMRERVHALGGTLECTSHRGTCVRVTLPTLEHDALRSSGTHPVERIAAGALA